MISVSVFGESQLSRDFVCVEFALLGSFKLESRRDSSTKNIFLVYISGCWRNSEIVFDEATCSDQKKAVQKGFFTSFGTIFVPFLYVSGENVEYVIINVGVVALVEKSEVHLDFRFLALHRIERRLSEWNFYERALGNPQGCRWRFRFVHQC